VLANPHFADTAAAAGVELVPIGAPEDYATLTRDPDTFDGRRGFRRVMAYVTDGLRPLYDALATRADDDTVVLAHPLAFAAAVARDRLGVPVLTAHLSPGSLRSAYAPPRLPGVFSPAWMPRPYKQAVWWATDRLLLDRVVGPPVNALRRELGLAPVKRLFQQTWDAPSLGLFPDWFAPAQPDWPAQMTLAGFPLYDGDEPAPLDELEQFLDEGDAPVVCTPGSGNGQAKLFLRAAVDACRRLDLRAILLTRFAEQVPPLPASMRHFSFAPLGRLLPRARALVHHGGIGTCAAALRAGLPQLIIPFSHDQPDNAARIERLGVGLALAPRRLDGRVVAGRLRELAAPQLRAEARAVARRFEGVDAMAVACDAIERACAPARHAGARR
jgi:UDP:flavonoid glycosyltransferase YjiC (YdhE family)